MYIVVAVIRFTLRPVCMHPSKVCPDLEPLKPTLMPINANKLTQNALKQTDKEEKGVFEQAV